MNKQRDAGPTYLRKNWSLAQIIDRCGGKKLRISTVVGVIFLATTRCDGIERGVGNGEEGSQFLLSIYARKLSGLENKLVWSLKWAASMVGDGIQEYIKGCISISEKNPYLFTHIKKSFASPRFNKFRNLHIHMEQRSTQTTFQLFLLLMKTTYCMVYHHTDRLSEVVVRLLLLQWMTATCGFQLVGTLKATPPC